MSLQIWLPLCGNIINQGLNSTTFTSLDASHTTINTSGKIGQCYANDSYTAGGLRSTTTVDLGPRQSMFCWVNFTSFRDSDTFCGIISQHRKNVFSGMGLTIKKASATTGYLSVSTGNGTARTYQSYCATTLMNAGTWYHVGYTYDGTNIRLYVNGVLEKTQSYSNMYTPADYITVFCWSMDANTGDAIYSRYRLNGKLNDIRMYNHCLSPKEIEELAKGLVVHYKLDNYSNIYDCSGYRHDGVITGSLAAAATTARYSSAIAFTPGNIITSADGFPTGDNPIFTISFWVYIPTGTYNNYADILFIPAISGSLRVEISSSSQVDSSYLAWYNYPIGTNQGISINTIAHNTWNMITLVCDGSKFISYWNGVVKTQTNLSGTAYSPTGIIRLGEPSSSLSINCSISDLRVYATALTIAQIKELYNTSMTIDKEGKVYTREVVE